MSCSKVLVEYAGKNDIENLIKVHTLLNEDTQMNNLMHWHIQIAFKEAVKFKSINVI
jgi:hypothetical protein